MENYAFDLNKSLYKNQNERKQNESQIKSLQNQLDSFKSSLENNKNNISFNYDKFFNRDEDNNSQHAKSSNISQHEKSKNNLSDNLFNTDEHNNSQNSSNISQHAKSNNNLSDDFFNTYGDNNSQNESKNVSIEEKYKMPDTENLKSVFAKPNQYKFIIKDYNFERGVNIIDEKTKKEMLDKLEEINLGLNEKIYSKLQNDAVKMINDSKYSNLKYNEDDKLLIITYRTFINYLNENDKINLFSQQERNVIKEQIDNFKDECNTDMLEYLETLSSELVYNNQYDNFRSESDIELICLNQALELCLNDEETRNKFFSLSSDREDDNDDMDIEVTQLAHQLEN